MVNEEFKSIQDYKNEYLISSYGRVFSLKHDKPFEMKLRKGKKRYLDVKFSDNKRMYVHRLVANAFISNQDNLPCINHKDENKTNNHVDNLEWCIIKYNSNYGNGIKKRLESYYQNKKKLNE